MKITKLLVCTLLFAMVAHEAQGMDKKKISSLLTLVTYGPYPSTKMFNYWDTETIQKATKSIEYILDNIVLKSNLDQQNTNLLNKLQQTEQKLEQNNYQQQVSLQQATTKLLELQQKLTQHESQQQTLQQNNSQQQTAQQQLANQILELRQRFEQYQNQQQEIQQQNANNFLELQQKINQLAEQYEQHKALHKHKFLQKQFFYAAHSDLEKVKSLIQEAGANVVKEGVNINEPDGKGRTALHISSYLNQIKIVEFLLGLGAQTDLKDKLLQTPLHRAVIKGNNEVATRLLEKNPELVDQQDYNGNTVLHIATQKYNPWLTRYLVVNYNANTSVKNNYGQTALQIAEGNKDEKIIDTLK